MNQQDIAAALDAHLQLFDFPAEDIAWEGVTYRPTLPKPYLSVSLSSYAGTYVCAGPDAPMQHDGTYTIVVYGPQDAGREQTGVLAGAVKAHFARASVLNTTGGEHVILLSAAERPAITFGSWRGVPVMVTFVGTDS